MKTLQVFNFRNLYGSGLTESVPTLCEGLAREGVDVELFAPRSRPEWMRADFKMNVHAAVRGFGWLGWCPSMRRALRDAAKDSDLIHGHEVWTLPGLYASSVALKESLPCMISPRGTLSQVARGYSRWKKGLMWRGFRQRSVLRAQCLHATAKHECADIRAMGYRGPVAIVPNPVALPELPQHDDKPRRKRLVYLARIHPIKGVMSLVEGWRDLATEFPDWELAIAGVDDGGYQKHLMARAKELGLSRVTFPGPLFGGEKTEFLSRADLYCLPTTSDNFAITVAEALAHGTPVVTTTAAPWSSVEDRECGRWVEPEQGAVIEAVRSLMALSPEQLQAMGRRGRAWIGEEFGVDSRSRQMKRTYEWLLGGGASPAWVDSASG